MEDIGGRGPQDEHDNESWISPSSSGSNPDNTSLRRIGPRSYDDLSGTGVDIEPPLMDGGPRLLDVDEVGKLERFRQLGVVKLVGRNKLLASSFGISFATSTALLLTSPENPLIDIGIGSFLGGSAGGLVMKDAIFRWVQRHQTAERVSGKRFLVTTGAMAATLFNIYMGSVSASESVQKYNSSPDGQAVTVPADKNSNGNVDIVIEDKPQGLVVQPGPEVGSNPPAAPAPRNPEASPSPSPRPSPRPTATTENGSLAERARAAWEKAKNNPALSSRGGSETKPDLNITPTPVDPVGEQARKAYEEEQKRQAEEKAREDRDRQAAFDQAAKEAEKRRKQVEDQFEQDIRGHQPTFDPVNKPLETGGSILEVLASPARFLAIAGGVAVAVILAVRFGVRWGVRLIVRGGKWLTGRGRRGGTGGGGISRP